MLFCFETALVTSWIIFTIFFATAALVSFYSFFFGWWWWWSFRRLNLWFVRCRCTSITTFTSSQISCNQMSTTLILRTGTCITLWIISNIEIYFSQSMNTVEYLLTHRGQQIPWLGIGGKLFGQKILAHFTRAHRSILNILNYSMGHVKSRLT